MEEQQRLEKQRAEKELEEKMQQRLEKQRAEKELEEKMMEEQQRLEKQRVEKELEEKMMEEQQRLEKQRAEKELEEKMMEEQQRLEKQRAEKELEEKMMEEQQRLEKQRTDEAMKHRAIELQEMMLTTNVADEMIRSVVDETILGMIAKQISDDFISDVVKQGVRIILSKLLVELFLSEGTKLLFNKLTKQTQVESSGIPTVDVYNLPAVSLSSRTHEDGTRISTLEEITADLEYGHPTIEPLTDEDEDDGESLIISIDEENEEISEDETTSIGSYKPIPLVSKVNLNSHALFYRRDVSIPSQDHSSKQLNSDEEVDSPTMSNTVLRSSSAPSNRAKSTTIKQQQRVNHLLPRPKTSNKIQVLSSQTFSSAESLKAALEEDDFNFQWSNGRVKKPTKAASLVDPIKAPHVADDVDFPSQQKNLFEQSYASIAEPQMMSANSIVLPQTQPTTTAQQLSYFRQQKRLPLRVATTVGVPVPPTAAIISGKLPESEKDKKFDTDTINQQHFVSNTSRKSPDIVRIILEEAVAKKPTSNKHLSGQNQKEDLYENALKLVKQLGYSSSSLLKYQNISFEEYQRLFLQTNTSSTQQPLRRPWKYLLYWENTISSFMHYHAHLLPSNNNSGVSNADLIGLSLGHESVKSESVSNVLHPSHTTNNVAPYLQQSTLNTEHVQSIEEYAASAELREESFHQKDHSSTRMDVSLMQHINDAPTGGESLSFLEKNYLSMKTGGSVISRPRFWLLKKQLKILKQALLHTFSVASIPIQKGYDHLHRGVSLTHAKNLEFAKGNKSLLLLTLEEMICALAETKGCIGDIINRLQERKQEFLLELQLVCVVINVKGLIMDFPGGKEFYDDMLSAFGPSDVLSPRKREKAFHSGHDAVSILGEQSTVYNTIQSIYTPHIPQWVNAKEILKPVRTTDSSLKNEELSSPQSQKYIREVHRHSSILLTDFETNQRIAESFKQQISQGDEQINGGVSVLSHVLSTTAASASMPLHPAVVAANPLLLPSSHVHPAQQFQPPLKTSMESTGSSSSAGLMLSTQIPTANLYTAPPLTSQFPLVARRGSTVTVNREQINRESHYVQSKNTKRKAYMGETEEVSSRKVEDDTEEAFQAPNEIERIRRQVVKAFYELEQDDQHKICTEEEFIDVEELSTFTGHLDSKRDTSELPSSSSNLRDPIKKAPKVTAKMLSASTHQKFAKFRSLDKIISDAFNENAQMTTTVICRRDAIRAEKEQYILAKSTKLFVKEPIEKKANLPSKPIPVSILQSSPTIVSGGRFTHNLSGKFPTKK